MNWPLWSRCVKPSCIATSYIPIWERIVHDCRAWFSTMVWFAMGKLLEGELIFFNSPTGLFKSGHTMIEEQSLGAKAHFGSKVEPLQRDCGGGMAEYATQRHIFNFLEMKVLKLFLKTRDLCLVTCRALGRYAPARCRTVALRKKQLLTDRRATVPSIVKTVYLLRRKSCARFGLYFSIFLHIFTLSSEKYQTCLYIGKIYLKNLQFTFISHCRPEILQLRPCPVVERISMYLNLYRMSLGR